MPKVWDGPKPYKAEYDARLPGTRRPYLHGKVEGYCEAMNGPTSRMYDLLVRLIQPYGNPTLEEIKSEIAAYEAGLKEVRDA